jgi:hypothetical protein
VLFTPHDESSMIALRVGEDPPSYPQAEPNDCFQGGLTASGKVCAHVLSSIFWAVHPSTAGRLAMV